MQCGLHRHNFGGITTFDHCHIHRYCGVTSLNPDVPGHVHCMMGITNFNNGHIHRYVVETSPAIYVNGGHIHYYRTVTSFDHGHVHCMCGCTSCDY